MTDAAAEMVISLSRIGDPFIEQYIIEALDDGPGDQWIEAAQLSKNPDIQKTVKRLIEEEGYESQLIE